ncbi:PAS domain S-box protein [Psychroflexus sp. YR1-1]|uniref:histidine kinase n=1 Tax=Psychroflexus aurantiacus TaxID=2709310 RepID=A0A6B3R0M7_9FLAO|nr:PAS domain S-box protein [Psychroflexus aurantiacus]NEV94089.1 PAS domain S-box protein [Psychroflexus aurantiacus]
MDKNKFNPIDKYSLLDSNQDSGFDRLVEIAARVCECSHATLSILDKNRFWIKSSFNFDREEISKEDSFCDISIDNPNEVFIIRDASKEKTTNRKIDYLRSNNINFYAGKSIVDPDGYSIGTLCVFDSEAKKLSASQQHILKQLSQEAMDKIISHKESLNLRQLNNNISDGKSRFQTLLNNTGDLVFLLDSDLNFMEFYGKGDDLFMEKGSFIGKNIEDINLDKKLSNQIKLAVKASKLYHSSIPVEYELNRNGLERWFNMNVNVIQREHHNTEILCVIREVTGRKKTEEKLKLINNLLEEAESLAKVGGWRYDVKKRELFWTPILKDIAGIGPEVQPTIDEALFFFKAGENRELMTEKMSESIKLNTSYTGEFEVITAQKKHLWALVNIKPEIVNGECIAVYGSFQDITEVKSTKEKLKQERERLNNIINATNLGTWEWNIQTGESLFNQRFVEMMGYTQNEIPLDNSFEVWNNATHPEDLKKSNQLLDEHFERRTDFYQMELRLKHKLGHWIWVLDKGKVISWTEDGQPEWMFGTHQDISDKKALEKELKQNVQQFKNIFELSPVGIIITDFSSGEFLDVNKAMLEMLGYSEREILGKNIWSITPENETTASDHKQIQKLKDLKKLGPIEKVLKTKSGDLITVDINGLIHFDKHGRRIVISTLQDVTEQKKIEKKLKTSKAEAIKASQAKSEFVANMSHEMRTPLNGVIGFSDLLMKTPLNEVQHQYMRTVFQSAHILLDLINDVLDFSKIESGKLQLDTTKTDLHSITEEVIDLTKYEAHKKGLELILIVNTNVPDYVWVDSVRLKQILMNLLNNAIKFTDQGSVTLRVSLKNKSNHLSNLTFSVEDTGVGIAKENQKKIFNAFIQEDTSVTKKYGGTGLGLAISDKILNMMNSKLRLKSKTGQGSKFYFEVSLQSEYDLNQKNTSDTDLKHVLVISSIFEYFETIKNNLKAFKLKTHYAKDLKTASQKMNEFSPQIIFINQEHSITDSYQLVSKLKTHIKSKNTRFVLISKSNSSEYYENEDFIKHFDQLLTKPVKKSNLLKLILKTEKNENEVVADEINTTPVEETEGLKFLIAEDNLINMELIKSYLKNIYSSVNIFEAEDGLKAFKLFKKYSPDMVFSDIQMPNMNGYELAESIRKEKTGKTVPIIAITAGTVKGTKEKCIESGMNDYISKPILQESIKNIISKYAQDINKNPGKSLPEREPSKVIDKNETGDFKKSHLMNMIGHNEQFFNELIKLADETLTQALVDLEELENETEFKKLAHKIKGTALNLGASTLSDYALKIEKLKLSSKKELDCQKTRFKAEIKKLIDSLQVLR